MPHTLIELYTATPAWAALPPEQRTAFFDRIGAGMQQFDPARIAAVAMSRVATGWHRYFTTTHALGADDGMAQHLTDLAAL